MGKRNQGGNKWGELVANHWEDILKRECIWSRFICQHDSAFYLRHFFFCIGRKQIEYLFLEGELFLIFRCSFSQFQVLYFRVRTHVPTPLIPNFHQCLMEPLYFITLLLLEFLIFSHLHILIQHKSWTYFLGNNSVLL